MKAKIEGTGKRETETREGSMNDRDFMYDYDQSVKKKEEEEKA